VLNNTAKKRIPKTESPNILVPSAMVHAIAGPLLRYEAARCFDPTSSRLRPAPFLAAWRTRSDSQWRRGAGQSRDVPD
jgi:hypothetical protein